MVTGPDSQVHSLPHMILLITGATSGIGQAAALQLAKEAKAVVVFGRRAEKSRETTFKNIENVFCVAGDITSAEDVQSLVQKTLNKFGAIHGLINCAGVSARGPFLSLNSSNWQRATEVNVFGFANVCRAVLPVMIKSNFGRIINMSSRAAAKPNNNSSAYTASKAAAHMFMRSLAHEIDEQGYNGILINDLIPGPTKTEMNANGQPPEAVTPYIRELLLLPNSSPNGKTYFRGKLYNLMNE